MNNIFDEIKNSNTILLLTHENPDGDAVGSLMAFYHMLKEKKKKVDVIIPMIPETFLFLNKIDNALTESNDNYDLGIVLDCANVGRVGQNIKK